MPSTIIDSAIFQGIFATDEMRRVWSDENRTAVLPRHRGRAGQGAGRARADPGRGRRGDHQPLPARPDRPARLREQTERIGYPILGVVTQVNQLCRDGLGEYVPLGRHHPGHHRHRHRAADPRGPGPGRRRAHRDLRRDWPTLAKEHRDTPMIGRSNLQQAIPITFGYKMAGLLSAVERHRERLTQLRERVLVGEFAGAAGTLASLETGAMETQAGLCAELGLAQPVIAWHTIRDNIAEVGAFLGLVGGTLGKLSMDVKLMMQTEVGEVYEPFAHGRGSSSTMPQKRNPISSCYIHAAISVVRQHAAALMDAMVADHERSTGPWEIEWIVLPEAFCLMAGALKQARAIVEGLEVDAAAMRRNIDLTGGLVMSEAVMMGLGPYIGREYAHDLVYDLCRDAVASGRPLLDLLAEHPEISKHLDRDALAKLLRPGQLPGPGRRHGRPRARPAGRTAMNTSTGAARPIARPPIAPPADRSAVRADARRHLPRPVLPARVAARRRARPRRGPDRRHRRLRPAAARRGRRGQHADQQGGHRLAVRPARLRRGLPVRPGRGRPAVGGHQPQLRQHAGRRRPVRHRAGAGTGRGRHHDGARLQRQHPLAHRRHRANSRPAGHLRRRRADRRSGRHRGADPAELPGRLGRGHRLGLPDRAAHRRHRRRRGHLPRRRHAADDHPSRGTWASPAARPPTSSTPTPPCSNGWSRCGAPPAG